MSPEIRAEMSKRARKLYSDGDSEMLEIDELTIHRFLYRLEG